MALLDKINYLTLPNKISVQTSSQSAAGVQNWKDGSSSGSVRTSGSSVQDVEYKIGQYAVTEGSNTKASGQAAHAEGIQSTASGVSSHAEGVQAKALGNYSHAEGYYTQASGTSSHVEGMGTKSTHAYQHVFGTYNKLDSSSNSSNQKGTYVEIVGNGTNNNLTNARTLDWQGNEWLAGKLSFTGNTDIVINDTGSSITLTANNNSYINTIARSSMSIEHIQDNLPYKTTHGWNKFEITDGNPDTTSTQTTAIYRNGMVITEGNTSESVNIKKIQDWDGLLDYVVRYSTDWNTAATKVAQNNNTAANDFRVLLSNSASNSDETAASNKSANLRFMPSTSHLYVGGAGQDALITVSPRMHLGTYNRYTQDGQTESSTSYGVGIGISNALAYNAYLTVSGLQFQHWNASRPNGGTPSSTNYVSSSSALSHAHVLLRDYSGKDSLTTESELTSARLSFTNSAGTTYIVTPTKISHWDQVYNWYVPFQTIYQDNGITLEGTKGQRYFTYSSHSIVASQLGNRVNPVNPQEFTITAYQNGGVVSFNMVFQVTTAITNPAILFEFTNRYYPANALQCVIVKYANKRYTRPETLGAYISSSNNAIMANNLQANTDYRISGTYMLK